MKSLHFSFWSFFVKFFISFDAMMVFAEVYFWHLFWFSSVQYRDGPITHWLFIGTFSVKPDLVKWAGFWLHSAFHFQQSNYKSAAVNCLCVYQESELQTFCLYLCQILASFENFFASTFCMVCRSVDLLYLSIAPSNLTFSKSSSIFSSAKEVMFLSNFVCLSVCVWAR